MKPLQHFMFGSLFSLLLYYLFPSVDVYAAFVVFLSSFLIDVDHYLIYVIRKKDLSLRNAFAYYLGHEHKKSKKEGKNYVAPLCIFHTIESFIFLSALSYYFITPRYILIGFVFHYVLDLYQTGIVYKNWRLKTYSIFQHL